MCYHELWEGTQHGVLFADGRMADSCLCSCICVKEALRWLMSLARETTTAHCQAGHRLIALHVCKEVHELGMPQNLSDTDQGRESWARKTAIK
jgi:hypothetical protein